eukprot:484108_1
MNNLQSLKRSDISNKVEYIVEMARIDKITCGYTRDVEHRLHSIIPSEIQQILTTYVGAHFEYTYRFIWNIKPHQLQILIDRIEPFHIKSESFITHSIKWKIQARSNGKITLICLKKTDQCYRIISRCKFICNDGVSSYTFFGNYLHFAAQNCLPINEIKKHKLKQVNIIVDIQILQLIDWRKMITIHQQPIYYKTPFKKQSFSWNINAQLMKCMRDACIGQKFESDMHNGIWCLGIYPNSKRHTQRYKNKVCVQIQLCSLPKIVSKLKIEWEITCDLFREKMEDKSVPWNKLNVSGEGIVGFGRFCNWSCVETMDLLFTCDEFKTFYKMNVTVEINIVYMFDDKDCIIFDDEKWNECLV